MLPPHALPRCMLSTESHQIGNTQQCLCREGRSGRQWRVQQAHRGCARQHIRGTLWSYSWVEAICTPRIAPSHGNLMACLMQSTGACCLQVVVYNNLPVDWPLVSEGISIHWHGFSMNGAPWYDGVGYLAQCPIKAGANFTYRFQASASIHASPFWSLAILVHLKQQIQQAQACVRASLYTYVEFRS